MTNTRATTLLATALLLAVLGTARADESDITLKQAPGVDVVEGNCASCHSLDMIQMNFPVQDAKGWAETVGKMVHVMGAPISEDDQKQIIAYLSANYSK
jgi:mono/diheme cytochrome c family protein